MDVSFQDSFICHPGVKNRRRSIWTDNINTVDVQYAIIYWQRKLIMEQIQLLVLYIKFLNLTLFKIHV